MVMRLLILVSALTLMSHGNFVELCCSFTSTPVQKDIKMLTSMFDSLEMKLIMGCSSRVEKKCTCFENTWGCEKISITDKSSKEDKGTFEIDNVSPAVVFDQTMRALYPPDAHDKDENVIHFCEGTVATPFEWMFATQGPFSWSNKKHCFSSDNRFELVPARHTSIGMNSFTLPLKQMMYARYLNDGIETGSLENMKIEVTTSTINSYDSLRHAILQQYPDADITQAPYNPDGSFKLRMEEFVLTFPEERFACRSYQYTECLLNLYTARTRALWPYVSHLSADLLDLFMTTAVSPAVLLVYKPEHFEETQELAVRLDSSFGQSTLSNYTIALMEESVQHKSGNYFLKSPSNIQRCEEEVYNCLSKALSMYLASPAPILSPLVDAVFGEHQILRMDDHRGNLNNPMFFTSPHEYDYLNVVKSQLRNSDRKPVLEGESTELRVVDSAGYYKAIQQGTFLLFVFRSDLASLMTIQHLLKTQIQGLLIVECFNLNLICSDLGILTFPTVLYGRDNDTMRYTGPLEAVAMSTFQSLISHPVVTPSHRIQVDLVLKNPDMKAAVLVSSGKTHAEETFHLACNELYGLVRCYLLPAPEQQQDMLLVHVPSDPVMINKKYRLEEREEGEERVADLVRLIRKLSTHSVISESELVTHYKELQDIVLFDQILDDELAVVVNTFPFVHFVQITDDTFKHTVLKELIGYSYSADTMVFISKGTNSGYLLPEEATVQTWITGVLEGTLKPDFELKDMAGTKYKFHNIFYKTQFEQFESSVRSMRERVEEMNSGAGKRGNEYKSHLEL